MIHLVPRHQALLGWNHFLCTAYSQLTRREDLHELAACLNSQRSKLYHIGNLGKISRSTLADASEWCDWRLFEALGLRMTAIPAVPVVSFVG